MINEIPTEMMPETFIVPITVPPVTYAKVIIQGENITIEPRYKTNGDRVRAKTDEELAKLIVSDWCEILCGAPATCDGNCEGRAIKWLKQEIKP